MNNYPIGDFLIQIKNAARANRREVVCETSKLKVSVAEALKREGILSDVSVKEDKLNVTLTYHKKEPMLLDLKLVSKPGLRKYMSVDDLLTRKHRRSTFLILSTPQGVMSSKEAIKNKSGGEVIAEVW